MTTILIALIAILLLVIAYLLGYLLIMNRTIKALEYFLLNLKTSEE